MSCDGAVRVTSRLVERSFAVGVANDCFVPVLVELSLPELVNSRSTQPLPVRRVVGAGAEVRMTTVEAIEPRAQFRYRSRFSVIRFGAAEPVRESAYDYAFPFGGSEPRLLVQGVDGGFTHQGRQRHAFDFALPRGTPVLAARDGIALLVSDGFPDGGPDPYYESRWNAVHVLHADGTIATYGHLSSGVRAKAGDRVASGDLLGLSGNSGYSRGPHLHFQVNTQMPDGAQASIPIRFQGGVVPSAGRSYGPYAGPRDGVGR